jgi:hypothetical protein
LAAYRPALGFRLRGGRFFERMRMLSMTSEIAVVQVLIPGPSASRSKMQKKGWKCWAKRVLGVKSPANSGYDWEGDFLAVGQCAEMRVGDVVLHVDDSGNSGVGLVQPDGTIEWEETCHGKWASALAAPARRLLALAPEQRIGQPAAAKIG